jgi:nucleoside-diphosphate-sugar epimerase
MSYSVKECYEWGVLGCGWLGQAFARQILSDGGTVWGSAKSEESLDAIAQLGAKAVAFDAHANQPIAFPPCHHLLVAWPPKVGPVAAARAIDLCQTEHTKWTVCISSTSVYPDQPDTYTEGRAERRISPHSGVCVLDIERATESPTACHLRAGGLIGPQRPLLRKPRRQTPQDKPLNVVHIDDVIGAIKHAVQHQMTGAFNLVSPIHRTREACAEIDAQISTETPPEFRKAEGARIISSQRLIETGFAFQHPDPAFFPNLTS